MTSYSTAKYILEDDSGARSYVIGDRDAFLKNLTDFAPRFHECSFDMQAVVKKALLLDCGNIFQILGSTSPMLRNEAIGYALSMSRQPKLSIFKEDKDAPGYLSFDEGIARQLEGMVGVNALDAIHLEEGYLPDPDTKVSYMRLLAVSPRKGRVERFLSSPVETDIQAIVEDFSVAKAMFALIKAFDWEHPHILLRHLVQVHLNEYWKTDGARKFVISNLMPEVYAARDKIKPSFFPCLHWKTVHSGGVYDMVNKVALSIGVTDRDSAHYIRCILVSEYDKRALSRKDMLRACQNYAGLRAMFEFGESPFYLTDQKIETAQFEEIACFILDRAGAAYRRRWEVEITALIVQTGRTKLLEPGRPLRSLITNLDPEKLDQFPELQRDVRVTRYEASKDKSPKAHLEFVKAKIDSGSTPGSLDEALCRIADFYLTEKLGSQAMAYKRNASFTLSKSEITLLRDYAGEKASALLDAVALFRGLPVIQLDRAYTVLFNRQGRLVETLRAPEFKDPKDLLIYILKRYNDPLDVHRHIVAFGRVYKARVVEGKAANESEQ